MQVIRQQSDLDDSIAVPKEMDLEVADNIINSSGPESVPAEVNSSDQTLVLTEQYPAINAEARPLSRTRTRSLPTRRTSRRPGEQLVRKTTQPSVGVEAIDRNGDARLLVGSIRDQPDTSHVQRLRFLPK